MDQATLKRLQPADETHAALRLALSAVAAERAAVMQRATDARARQTEALTGGTAREVMKAQDDAREGDIVLQQLDLMRGSYEARLPAARAAEVIASLRDKQARAEAAVQRFRDAWPEYRGYAERIAGIMRVEMEAVNAIAELRHALQHVANVPGVAATGALGSITLPQLPGVAALAGAGRSTASGATKLPAAAEGEPPVWWTRS